MGISPRKQRQQIELRESILDAAEAIFVKEGADCVTMRRIAAAVEYAPTVLYRLFDHKEDLMDHLIARGYEGVRGRYQEVLAEKHGDPLHTLQRILEVYTDYALTHPNHYRMWFETSSLRLVKNKMKMSHGRLEYVVFQTWLDAIEDCRKAGLWGKQSARKIFQILWARLHGMISLRLQSPGFPWQPVQQHLKEVVWQGLDRTQ